MSKFTKVWSKVLKEKLVANTNVAGVDLSLNDTGRLSAKGKVGGVDISANSDGHAQATGKIAGGTMSTAVNKDGDGGSAFSKDGKTVSHTAGSNDAWVSAGPNQISKKVPINSSKELDEVAYTSKTTRAQGVSPDYGFYTTAKGDKFALMFNDGKETVLVGTYDSHTELQQAKEHVEKEMRKGYRNHGVDMQKPLDYNITQDSNGQYVAKVNDSHFGEYVVGTYKTEKEAKWAIDFHNKSHDEEERMDTTGHELEEATDDIDYKDSDLWQANNSERTDDYTDKVEWEIVINGNTYTTSNGATEDEAINNFWKAVVEKEGIKKFLGDMVYAQELTSSTDLDEDLNEMLKIAGLR